MPTLTSTALNPGAGGANVVTDQQSTGNQMPISELAASPDGVQDSKPVTGVNPLPVVDQYGNNARDDLRLNMQAIVDLLTTSVLQVAAKITGQQAGLPDVTNVMPVQGVSGGVTMAVAPTSPGGGAATVFPNGFMRVQAEPTQIFLDAYDTGTFDTTNRWNAPVTSGGGTALVNNQAQIQLGSGTTPGGYAYVQTQVAFSQTAPGFLHMFHVINLEQPILTNAYRFWGTGTVPTVPTAASPLVDAVGWEINTDGRLYAVTYAGGGRNVIGALAGVMPKDAQGHKYITHYRGDIAFWSIDTLDNVVATMGFGASGPNNNILPILFLAIAGSPAPTSSAVTSSNVVWLGDTCSSGTTIRDGTYSQRLATVKAGNVAPVKSDGALTVAISPNTPTATDESGVQRGVPLQRGGSVVAVMDQVAADKFDMIIMQLESIKWILENAFGASPLYNDPSHRISQ